MKSQTRRFRGPTIPLKTLRKQVFDGFPIAFGLLAQRILLFRETLFIRLLEFNADNISYFKRCGGMPRGRVDSVTLPFFGIFASSSNMNNTSPIQRLDVTSLSNSSPLLEPLDLLFIHHSCGGELFAAAGAERGTNCILVTHTNGGGLRAVLEKEGYRVHEASYGSKLGENTDIFDWLPKFRTEMEDILACDMQDARYQDGRHNEVVMFKSCFPNNEFVGEGTAPGKPEGPELTVWNAKATYTALLGEFRKHPQVLFVCVRAPPMARIERPKPLLKRMAKNLRGRGYLLATSGPLAREFNNWLSSTDGWLKGYGLKNVVVFDYYDILTGRGRSDFCAYATENGYDSHPSREGNEKAAEALGPFLNRAVRRLGLGQSAPVAGAGAVGH